MNFIDSIGKMKTVGELVADLLTSVVVMHHKHLTTTSYELHKALNIYYNDMPALIDGFAEVVIANGIAIPTPPSVKLTQEPVAILNGLMLQCKSVHALLETEKMYDVINTLEDIMTFISSIVYKLNLK